MHVEKFRILAQNPARISRAGGTTPWLVLFEEMF
jgi:hypothetical protein